MKMSMLKEGESAVIKELQCENAFAVRLRDMGFVEGERVECKKIAALSSPVLYRVKGADIALRTGDAEKLEVSL